MTHVAPEYIAARKVLLDALDAVGEHRKSFVLVGAQAIYHHTGTVEGTGVTMTTDSDLALDADLLSDDPELTQALTDAGFTPQGQLPGQWYGEGHIRVDLMVVPHQSNRPAGKRAAHLPPHGDELARITPGLEPALIDNTAQKIAALDPADQRVAELRVAGPAALLSAKLTKVRERHRAVEAGKAKPSRLLEKDALDCYRLLLVISTGALTKGFESHRTSSEALAVTREGLAYFAEQRQAGADGQLRKLLAAALPGHGVALAQFDALSDDLLDALNASGIISPNVSDR